MERRILVMDGAMGTMVQRQGLSEEDFRGTRFADWGQDLRGNADLLSLTRPDLVRDLHTAYLRAGADLVETNTFSAQRISQADYGSQDLGHELNLAAARLAREAVRRGTATPDRPRFVARRARAHQPHRLDLARRQRPRPRATSPTTSWSRPTSSRPRGLLDGGVDALLVETIFDTLNAKAALFAIETLFDERGRRWPVMISGTITDASGRTLSGQITEAFWNSIRHAPPALRRPELRPRRGRMRPYVDELSRVADSLRLLLPQRRAAQCLRRLRRVAGGHRRASLADSPPAVW